jgi:hypothetical protein
MTHSRSQSASEELSLRFHHRSPSRVRHCFFGGCRTLTALFELGDDANAVPCSRHSEYHRALVDNALRATAKEPSRCKYLSLTTIVDRTVAQRVTCRLEVTWSFIDALPGSSARDDLDQSAAALSRELTSPTASYPSSNRSEQNEGDDHRRQFSPALSATCQISQGSQVPRSFADLRSIRLGFDLFEQLI